MDNETLMLSIMQDIQTKTNAFDERLRAIETKLVGQDKCTKIMEGYENRMRAVETSCIRYESLKEEIEEGHQRLMNRMTANELNIQSILDQRRLVDLTWRTVKSNPVLGAFATLLGLIVTGVYWGRAMELTAIYGLHAVLLSIFILTMAIISAWVSRHRAKKALKKMGVINILILLFLVVPVLAQDPTLVDGPPIIGNVEDTHPLTLQPDYMQRAVNIIITDIFGEQNAVDAKNAAILGNNSTNGFKFIPPNLTIA